MRQAPASSKIQSLAYLLQKGLDCQWKCEMNQLPCRGRSETYRTCGIQGSEAERHACLRLLTCSSLLLDFCASTVLGQATQLTSTFKSKLTQKQALSQTVVSSSGNRCGPSRCSDLRLQSFQLEIDIDITVAAYWRLKRLAEICTNNADTLHPAYPLNQLLEFIHLHITLSPKQSSISLSVRQVKKQHHIIL